MMASISLRTKKSKIFARAIENNNQYLYRVKSNEVFSDKKYRPQAIGVRIPEDMYTMMTDKFSDDPHPIGEYFLANTEFDIENVTLKDGSTNDCVLVEDIYSFFQIDEPELKEIIQSSIKSFVQDIEIKEYLARESDAAEKFHTNDMILTDRFYRMIVMSNVRYDDYKHMQSTINDLDYREYYHKIKLNETGVLERWLKVNSIRIYTENKSKSIRLINPLFGKRKAIYTDRYYYTLKFLVWEDKDARFGKYIYQIEVDPLMNKLQLLQVRIEGDIYIFPIKISSDSSDMVPYVPDNYWVNKSNDLYRRQLKDEWLIPFDEKPKRISMFDLVGMSIVSFNANDTNPTDCAVLSNVCSMLSTQVDLIRYYNYYESNYFTYKDTISFPNKLSAETNYDTDSADIIYWRLQKALGLKDIHIQIPNYYGISESKTNEVYISPSITLSSDMIARTSITELDKQKVANKTFAGEDIYKIEIEDMYHILCFDRMDPKNHRANKDILYGMFDYLGCNITNTIFPIEIYAHATLLIYNEGEYFILEPQLGYSYDAYERLYGGNGNYDDNVHAQYPSNKYDSSKGERRAAFLTFYLTHTNKKGENIVYSLASPLAFYSIIDPSYYKGNISKIMAMGIDQSYLLLRSLKNVDGFYESVIERQELLRGKNINNLRLAYTGDKVDLTATNIAHSSLSARRIMTRAGRRKESPEEFYNPAEDIVYVQFDESGDIDELLMDLINFYKFLDKPLSLVIHHLVNMENGYSVYESIPTFSLERWTRYLSLPMKEGIDKTMVNNPYVRMGHSLLCNQREEYSTSEFDSFYTRLRARMLSYLAALEYGLLLFYIQPDNYKHINLQSVNRFINMIEYLYGQVSVTIRNPLSSVNRVTTGLSISPRRIEYEYEKLYGTYFPPHQEVQKFKDMLYMSPLFVTLMYFCLSNQRDIPLNYTEQIFHTSFLERVTRYTEYEVLSYQSAYDYLSSKELVNVLSLYLFLYEQTDQIYRKEIDKLYVLINKQLQLIQGQGFYEKQALVMAIRDSLTYVQTYLMETKDKYYRSFNVTILHERAELLNTFIRFVNPIALQNNLHFV